MFLFCAFRFLKDQTQNSAQWHYHDLGFTNNIIRKKEGTKKKLTYKVINKSVTQIA